MAKHSTRAAFPSGPNGRRGGPLAEPRSTRPRNETFVTKENSRADRQYEQTCKTESLLDLLKAIQAQVEKNEAGFRANTYRTLKDVYGLVERFRNEPEEWADFRELVFWEACKRKKPTIDASVADMMLFVLRFVYKATVTQGQLYNRLYKYSRTLCVYESKGVEAEAVEERLADEGTDFLFATDEADTIDEQPAPARTDDPEVGPEERRNPEPRVRAQERGRDGDRDAQIDKPVPMKKPPSGIEVLKVEIDTRLLDRTLRLRPRQQADLLVERVGGPPLSPHSGGVRIVAKKLTVRQNC